MDSITHAPVGSAATRSHVDSEWSDMRPSLDRVALQARALIAALRDIPRPLFAHERRASDKAREAFAEQIKNGLLDMLDDLLGPVGARADEAGIDTDTLAVDLIDFNEEYYALERECRQTCVTQRSA